MSSFLFPQCPTAFDHANRNECHSHTAFNGLCNGLLHWVQEDMLYVPACAPTCLMEAEGEGGIFNLKVTADVVTAKPETHWLNTSSLCCLRSLDFSVAHTAHVNRREEKHCFQTQKA